MPTVKKDSYSGAGKVYDQGPDGLAAAVRGIAQTLAKSEAAGVTSLTDSTGGSSGGDIVPAHAAFSGHSDGGTDSAAKAGFDTEWADLRNCLAILAEQVNDIAAVVPAAALTDNTGGTGGTNTLPAIGNTGPAVDGAGNNAVSFANVSALVTEFLDRAKEIVVEVNKLARACGLTELTMAAGKAVHTGVLAAVAADSGAGVDATNGNSISKVEADALLVDLADIVATIAAKLNACTAAGTTIHTVAG